MSDFTDKAKDMMSGGGDMDFDAAAAKAKKAGIDITPDQIKELVSSARDESGKLDLNRLKTKAEGMGLDVEKIKSAVGL